MGCWDTFCLLCGNSCHPVKYNDYNLNEKEFEILKNITSWLNKCTILTANNEVIHNCKETSCNIDFTSPNNDRYISDMNYKFTYPFDKNKGLFIHDDCWLYIKNKYKIELKISDLAIIKKKSNRPLLNIKYNDIEKYWNQDFDFTSIVKDNCMWMCASPLLLKKNALRIDTIIKQLKIKKDRKGPSLSASFYKSNIIKFGNNNKFWIIKNGKWTEMKGGITITKVKLEKKHYKIPQLGEINNKPLFIKNFITENKKHYVNIISLTI